MSRAYASAIINSPIGTVWNIVRDFNGLPNWAANIVDSTIEGGLDADVVGCVRSFHTAAGDHIRERLLSLDDSRYNLAYNFEKPAFPVKNYLANIRLMPVTHSNTTFAEWEATFDETPADQGKYEKLISEEVFAAGLTSLNVKINREILPVPEKSLRWKAGQPNKVWTSRVIKAPVENVWSVMRDFSGMETWHGEITRMKMLDGARADKVSGIRDFYFGAGHINEELLHLCDLTRSFSYRITHSDIPWINYVSGPRIWPVTSDNSTFGVWTGDWDASPQDDVDLIPRTENNVYQKAFASLEKKLQSV